MRSGKKALAVALPTEGESQLVLCIFRILQRIFLGFRKQFCLFTGARQFAGRECGRI